ncbi:MAG: CusA/CzcA family heavy metal efflux RND transporter [Alphaproteobacteria bacterium]|nr:CusA/CzcA family heavy metal efflux RND transporter [Alphaproteobacteria bacterium]
MFNLLVTGSLRNRLFVLALAGVLVAYGALTLRTLPVDVFPDLNKPTVTLMTEAHGLAPEEVETLVTFPIETAMNGMAGVSRVRSVSGAGLSIVYVEFDWGTDIYLNRQQISERFNIVREQLPDDVVPQMAPVTSIMGEIMLIAVASKSQSAMETRELADWVLRPRLLTIPGVAQVIPIGGEVRQYRISLDTAQMSLLGTDRADVEAAIAKFGTNSAGGFVDQHAREYLIRNLGRTTKLEDLRNLPVAYREGVPIRLRQVAEVDYAAKVKRGDAGYMGQPAVILSVQKQPSSDSLRLTEDIEGALADLRRVLPKDVEINVLFQQADFIKASVKNVQTVLVEAMVVVAVVLFAFLLNWRTTFISLTAIPISILITVIVFQFFGMSINTMTLGGLAIAIGELVDDAVVDVENVFRRLRENAQKAVPDPVLRVIARASQEVRSGIIYATAIIILVFVPLFALTGIEGRLFAPLGVAYIVSILASLVTSITVTPVLCYYLLPKSGAMAHGDGFLVRFLKSGNRRLLGWAFRKQGFLMAAAATAVVAAAISATNLPRAFLPAFNEGTLTISMLFRPGISLAESHRVGLIAEQLILQVGEVLTVGRRTGRAELDEHAEGVHSAEIDVDLKASERGREEIIDDIRARLAVLPASVNVGQPISHRLDHMLSGIRAQIALKVFGEDLDTLSGIAEQLKTRMQEIPGLVDVSVERQVRIPQVQVSVNYEQAYSHGITPAAVTEALATLINGSVVSQIVEGNRRYDVVLRVLDRDRTTEGLRNLKIDTPSGPLPLSTFAEIVETDGPNQISRENTKRRTYVLANSDGSDMSRIVADLRAMLNDLDLPEGYFTSLEGTFQAQEDATRTIALLSLISLFGIFVVLYSRYRSAVLALIIMGNIPLALIGSVIALWLADLSLSVATMIGFITLAGISARNGILKISHYINLVMLEGETFGRDMVVRGCLERLVPVLMTALSAGLALIPLMIGADAPGKEILHPVAITIFGGLISSTLLDTVLTPVLFLRYGEKPLKRLIEEREVLDSLPASEAAY